MSVPRRGASEPGFHLITPENRYPSRLPGLAAATAYKLVTPRRVPARFAEYLLELTGGVVGAPGLGEGFEHFVFVIDGRATVAVGGAPLTLAAGGFAYVCDGEPLDLRSDAKLGGRVLWVKRRYEPVHSLERPPSAVGSREDAPEVEVGPGMFRRELVPTDDERRDFAMSSLRFAPGAGLGMVEIHDEEHGLFMTAGSGDYRLGDHELAIGTGDFIYMAPYCPQSFRAGPAGAEYLLYKDVGRDGF